MSYREYMYLTDKIFNAGTDTYRATAQRKRPQRVIRSVLRPIRTVCRRMYIARDLISIYYADCCVNTDDEKILMANTLVNFGQMTLPWQPILWR